MDERKKTAPAKKRGRPKKTDSVSKSTNTAAKKSSKPTLDPKNVIFALDIGTRTIVGVVGTREGELFHVADFEQMEHPGRAMMDGQVEDIAQVAALVGEVKSRLEERNGIKLTSVAIASAGRKLKTVKIKVEREIDGKSIADKEFVIGLEGEAIEKAQIEMESNRELGNFYCVGYSIIGYEMDGQRISNLIGHSCSRASVELIAAFLPFSVVESLYAAVDMNGLEVASLTLEPIAAMNVLIPRELRLLNLVLVDIGAGTSDIAICRDGAISSYDMATIAGDEITEAIIRDFLVDFETAEMLKRGLSSGDNEIHYTDVLGMDSVVTADHLLTVIAPATEQLAQTIAEKIIDVNQTPPAAVFLIGGGCLIPGLGELVSQNLGIPPTKVAVGSRRTLKGVLTSIEALRGPEFVTPLGIAVTSITQECFHFFGVIVNDKRIKLLNSRKIRMMDVLLMAGFRISQIMGHSGRALMFTLNGKPELIRGTMAEQAELKCNDEQASIDTQVRPGDHIAFVAAVDGEDACASIADVTQVYPRGKAWLDDEEFDTGSRILVNGQPQTADYIIASKDEVWVSAPVTLTDICEERGIDITGIEFVIDDKLIGIDSAIDDGARIYSRKAAEPQINDNEAEPSEDEFITDDVDELDEEIVSKPVSDAINSVASEAAAKPVGVPVGKPESEAVTDADSADAITDDEQEQEAKPFVPQSFVIKLNGRSMALNTTTQKQEYYVMDMLDQSGIDASKPNGQLIMRQNGIECRFMDVLRDGDIIEIRWSGK